MRKANSSDFYSLPTIEKVREKMLKKTQTIHNKLSVSSAKKTQTDKNIGFLLNVHKKFTYRAIFCNILLLTLFKVYDIIKINNFFAI